MLEVSRSEYPFAERVQLVSSVASFAAARRASGVAYVPG